MISGSALCRVSAKGFAVFRKAASSFSRPQTMRARPIELGLGREDQPHVVARINAPLVARLRQIVVKSSVNEIERSR